MTVTSRPDPHPCSVCGGNHGCCVRCGLPWASLPHAGFVCRCGALPPSVDRFDLRPDVTHDVATRRLTDGVDPHAELRRQRAILLSAIRKVKELFSRVVFRERDELASFALTELLVQTREHLMLAAFVDRALDTVSDTEPPPADPTLLTCTECQGTGRVTCERDDVHMCGTCFGAGCT